jgi:hypothetical protein
VITVAFAHASFVGGPSAGKTVKVAHTTWKLVDLVAGTWTVFVPSEMAKATFTELSVLAEHTAFGNSSNGLSS